MGNPAGVARDFDALEKRRMKAVRLLEKGDLNQSEIAVRLKVCRQTVSRWAEEYNKGGKQALRQAGRVGLYLSHEVSDAHQQEGDVVSAGDPRRARRRRSENGAR